MCSLPLSGLRNLLRRYRTASHLVFWKPWPVTGNLVTAKNFTRKLRYKLKKKNNTQSAQSAVCSPQSAWSAFQHDRVSMNLVKTCWLYLDSLTMLLHLWATFGNNRKSSSQAAKLESGITPSLFGIAYLLQPNHHPGMRSWEIATSW